MPPSDDSFRAQLTSGTFVSVLLHAVVLAVLIFGLPESRLKPHEPDSIEVEIVKPPEPPKTAEAPPPPPPPAPEEPEQKPEPQPAPQVEEPKPEEKPEEKPEIPPTNVMQPVFKFAEEDAGSTHAE